MNNILFPPSDKELTLLSVNQLLRRLPKQRNIELIPTYMIELELSAWVDSIGSTWMGFDSSAHPHARWLAKQDKPAEHFSYIKPVCFPHNDLLENKKNKVLLPQKSNDKFTEELILRNLTNSIKNIRTILDIPDVSSEAVLMIQRMNSSSRIPSDSYDLIKNGDITSAQLHDIVCHPGTSSYLKHKFPGVPHSWAASLVGVDECLTGIAA